MLLHPAGELMNGPARKVLRSVASLQCVNFPVLDCLKMVNSMSLSECKITHLCQRSWRLETEFLR